MTYMEALRTAYQTYERYRIFHEWATSHCDDADNTTIDNMRIQDAIMWAEVHGQLVFIARMFSWSESKVHCDLKDMYEERRQA